MKEAKPRESAPKISKKAVPESELRQRKGEKEEKSEWVNTEESSTEENDNAEVIFEEKVLQSQRDPLYMLNPFPSTNQRNAQKTLRKSSGIN